MIDAGPSLEAAKGLTGAALLGYLVTHGWTARPSRIDGIAIISRELPGADGPLEFPLPVEPGWEEEERRIADALRVLEAVERRPMLKIVADVRGASREGFASKEDQPSSVVGAFRDEPGDT
jgi:hypothetical protein